MAQNAEKTDLSELQKQRSDARALRFELGRLIHVADGRLARPRLGSSAFPRPHGTDWAWRPQLWRATLPVLGQSSAPSGTKLGDEVELFHDCAASELTLRQLRNMRKEDLAPFGLHLDVFRFDGSFLSLAIDLPQDAALGLCQDHLVRLEAIIEVEAELGMYARLNIQHGPNHEHINRKLPVQDKSVQVEFDIAEVQINEKRVNKIWLDLIFEAPEMNQVILRDLTLARYRRAAL